MKYLFMEKPGKYSPDYSKLRILLKKSEIYHWATYSISMGLFLKEKPETKISKNDSQDWSYW